MLICGIMITIIAIYKISRFVVTIQPQVDFINIFFRRKDNGNWVKISQCNKKR